MIRKNENPVDRIYAAALRPDTKMARSGSMNLTVSSSSGTNETTSPAPSKLPPVLCCRLEGRHSLGEVFQLGRAPGFLKHGPGSRDARGVGGLAIFHDGYERIDGAGSGVL